MSVAKRRHFITVRGSDWRHLRGVFNLKQSLTILFSLSLVSRCQSLKRCKAKRDGWPMILPRNVLQMYSEIWFPDLLVSAKCRSSRLSIRLNWAQHTPKHITAYVYILRNAALRYNGLKDKVWCFVGIQKCFTDQN